MDAQSLRCPQCGAATRSGAHRCLYCRARLATVSCPSCFSAIFAEAAYCNRCGVRRSRREEAASAHCPACRGDMQAVRLGDVSTLECLSCDGLWLDAEAFEGICINREAQAAVLHKSTTNPPALEKRVSYRPCLRCGTMMNRINFGRLSGTIVDVCKGHGTFLDHGELEAIVTFIQGGGIDRARQRQIEDLKEQEHRLRDQQARLAQTRYGSGRGPNSMASNVSFSSLIDFFHSR